MAVLFVLPLRVSAQEASIIGKIIEKGSDYPLDGVVVKVDDGALWAVTDTAGRYSFSNLSPGKYTISTECLGYVSVSREIIIKGAVAVLDFELETASLAIKEVSVIAQRSKTGLNTTTNLGRDALNHLQVSSLTDVSSLLPGGKTANPDLTTSSTFSLRQGGNSAGNASFGTAVEVDGIRVGGNAGFSEMSGADTRSISVDNVESVEVITGVPSAEYGDLNSGMVRIHTKRGKTPTNVNFSVNPRTTQTSVSKGVGIGTDGSILNVSAEWARAVKKLVSPYDSYTRRGISLALSNNAHKGFRYEATLSGNIGGMNSEDDPDAFDGEYKKGRANTLRAGANATWTPNKSWITSLKADASVSFSDDKVHEHLYKTSASNQPAVHAAVEGYHLADSLPKTYFADRITDSRELDFAASLKYSWNRNFGAVKSKMKAGSQWKSSGNVGSGEYYEDASLAENGYRPRPYYLYPFMHTLSLYAEEDLDVPIGGMRLDMSFGLRQENVFIKGSSYEGMNTLSPRFNAKLKVNDNLSVRGGWGLTEKLPSYYILYPKQEYRDIQTFALSYGNKASYVYYTMPYKTIYNPDLKWQQGRNSEVGIEYDRNGFGVSLVGYFNITHLPYQISYSYEPFAYVVSQKSSGLTTTADTQIKADAQTGEVYVRPSADEGWSLMDTKVIDTTFVSTASQTNGADVKRAGLELTMDLPEIKPIHTKFRIDAAYNWTGTHDENLAWYYQSGKSHTSLTSRSYQYVGIYANRGNNQKIYNGKVTNNLDANFTAITHIPEARLIITLRLEASLLNRFRYTSTLGGKAYAQKQEDGRSYILPVAYMGLDGMVHDFTEAEASNPEFEQLIIKSSNIYTLNQDGYGPYCSANLSITKEVGEHVSISFFANNFTNSRPYVTSIATGVGAIFTPSFYYGLTCRLKL